MGATRQWLLAAFTLEAVLVVVLPAMTPGHVPWRDWISEAAANGAPYSRWFLPIGAIGAACHLVAIHKMQDHASGGRLAALTIAAVFPAFLTFSLIFHCDPGCAHGTGEAITHYTFGILSFLSLGLAALIWSWMTRNESGMDAWAARVHVGVSAVLLLADRVNVMQGAMERIAVATMMWWMWSLSGLQRE